ncbi:large ribosomal subunit protein bL12-like [Bolinopsis microptera]|uniref:large ribosomal subunit protein bL12-like n=1 Tax=Bolinopsis microptera TaxID=2820187 RepID=UPI00307ADB59
MMQVCLRRGVQCGLRRTLRVRCLSAVPAPQIDSESGVAGVPEHVLSLADQICGLSLHETGQLTKVLKERLGIGEIALAGPAAAAAPAAETEAEPEPVVEEKTSFDVRLLGIDSSMKIKLIKALKETIPDLNLVAAKKMVESAPCMLREKIPKAEAEALKAKLTEFGGDVALE